MAKCHHCDGTGTAPDRITLECIGCQKGVTVIYRDTAELRRKCEEIRCAECKKVASPRDPGGTAGGEG